MPLFQTKIEQLEKEDVKTVEVTQILYSTLRALKSRQDENFISLTVTKLLNSLENNDISTTDFRTEIKMVYASCIEYLQKWIKDFEDFSCFQWMSLEKNMKSFSNVTLSLEYLSKMGVVIDDVKLFDEYEILKEYCKNINDDCFSNSLTTQWCNFFISRSMIGDSTELLKICSYVFAILAHNANAERIFSHINSQWIKERNRLTIKSMKAILMIQANFKNIVTIFISTY